MNKKAESVKKVNQTKVPSEGKIKTPKNICRMVLPCEIRAIKIPANELQANQNAQ